MKKRERRAELWLGVIVVVWAVNYPVAKYGLAGLDPYVFNAIRFLVATIVVALMILRRSGWVRIDPADRMPLFRAGVIGGVLYQMAFIIGLSKTTAGNTSVLIATSPLWTIVLNARLNREKIGGLMWGGMVTSFAGVAMIIIGSGARLSLGGSDLMGDGIVLFGAALWGLTTALQRPLLQRYSADQISFTLALVGAAGLSIVAIPAALTLSWGSVHWTYYGAAILSGMFSIGIGNTIWSYGVQQIGPGRAANFNNLVPVLAFVISYFTLNERLLTIQFIGAGITIAGVWLARR